MPEINSDSNFVRWDKLQGNQYIRALHPAMLTEAGCQSTRKANILGEPRQKNRYVTVYYDRAYVIGFLVTKVIKPLSNLGVTGIYELLKEAFKQAFPNQCEESQVTENDGE